ncbi:DUF4432 family protein [Cellulomonas sp. APG4]|uniref:DUF4432 family protein n=1 Tax=Cellulomonas sp. APG4 TaxID=1538656 RepID=UPI00137AC73E|nr:DUF4432 family protein [Cellulomonas sp. APG4]NCT90449.1 DUF4432 family protein [Cellulomonas sp. APG4]
MITAEHLTKRYGGTTAVDDLSFTVRPGVVTGFLGPNGAGKSTTMRMLVGLDSPTGGRITLDGRLYRDLPDPLRHVGVMLDARAVHPGRTAYRHLLAVAQTHQMPTAGVHEVLEMVGLSAVAHRRAGGFSLGMSQRLGVATAMLGDPRVLVLDEPVNDLDPDGVLWIRGLLGELAREGRTVFLSSHLMSELSLVADDLVIIGQGRLLAASSVDELLASAGPAGVRVVSPDASRLVSALRGPGVTVTATDRETFEVEGLDARRDCRPRARPEQRPRADDDRSGGHVRRRVPRRARRGRRPGGLVVTGPVVADDGARWGDLLEDGRVALPEALASVEELTRTDGRRTIAVRLAGGLAFEVLPDRGLDLGATWWGVTPLAWRSMHPVDPGPGHGWESRFLGGLLATCGPDNIGPPRDGAGQHGTHHLTPATDVHWSRRTRDGDVEVSIRGVVAHTTFDGPRLVVEREVLASTGTSAVEVRDVVRNVGELAVGVPLLYHVNLGAPLLRPGSSLVVDADDVVLREPLPPGRDPLVTPGPATGLAPVVAEHRGLRSPRAVLRGDADHPDVVVTWSGDSLPRLCTWSWPARGAYVLGVEPTNAPLFGPERDTPHAGAPVLAPGASWRTGVRIAVEPVTDRGAS